MDVDTKFNLITNNLEEIMNENELINIINNRDIKIYWGTAPTGRIHIGYLLPFYYW